MAKRREVDMGSSVSRSLSTFAQPPPRLPRPLHYGAWRRGLLAPSPGLLGGMRGGWGRQLNGARGEYISLLICYILYAQPPLRAPASAAPRHQQPCPLFPAREPRPEPRIEHVCQDIMSLRGGPALFAQIPRGSISPPGDAGVTRSSPCKTSTSPLVQQRMNRFRFHSFIQPIGRTPLGIADVSLPPLPFFPINYLGNITAFYVTSICLLFFL